MGAENREPRGYFGGCLVGVVLGVFRVLASDIDLGGVWGRFR
jgi:hypothetical protein